MFATLDVIVHKRSTFIRWWETLPANEAKVIRGNQVK